MDLELIEQCAGSGAESRPRHEACSRAGAAERDVLGEGEVQHESVTVSIAGDEAGGRWSIERSARDRNATCQGAEQLANPAPFDAGDSDNLSAVNLERRISNTHDSPIIRYRDIDGPRDYRTLAGLRADVHRRRQGRYRCARAAPLRTEHCLGQLT